MKTAMEKKEIGLMRQIGYLSFVVVLLYGLTLFAVSCDNDEDPPLPPAVEKVVLAFGVHHHTDPHSHDQEHGDHRNGIITKECVYFISDTSSSLEQDKQRRFHKEFIFKYLSK